MSPETAAAIRAAVKAPAGFTVTAFAAPPVVNYPTCVTATHDGVVFVCVDRNGSLQADTGMGYIVRLVDKDRNGEADEYTVFAALDSPRGAVFDGEALYVSHPPFVTALRDTDGDGIADDRRTLVRGLGFGLDFRGADHTTNGLEMGIDGWLYVAVGDYGFVKATGSDGQEIQLRGGGNVRVRPDGTELEIYSRGTRNDYDVAIDPYLNLFARGNTNDGGGFDIRLYHFVAGATFGYPTLFRNFSDEVVPPLADYGTGSGTGMLYVHDSALPAAFGNTLYSVDWGKNAVYQHALQPKGATFSATQSEFIGVPRPNDLAIDGSSSMYLASWEGGEFRYRGEKVGWVARLTHQQAKPAPPVDLAAATDETARGAGRVGKSGDEPRGAGCNVATRPVAGATQSSRAAGGFRNARRTRGSDLHLEAARRIRCDPAARQLAGDPAVRAFALRALADRRGDVSDAAKPLFIRALADTDPRVALEAITGLRRIGATDAAAAMLPLTSSSDPVIANVAVNALVALSAIDAPLAAVKGPSDEHAAGALRVLQQIHQPAAVTGLVAALSDAPPARRGAILQALARLHNREGVWRGTLAEWWGTRPDTTGPYYDPVAWEESGRIRSVLLGALLESAAGAGPRADFTRLVGDLQRNRVLPPGGDALLLALGTDRHALLGDVARALMGRVRIVVDPPTGQLLDVAARANNRYRAAIVRIVVAAGPPTPAAGALLLSAAVDQKLDADARAAALTALASSTGPDALRRSVDGFSSLVAPVLAPPLEPVWAQFISTPAHAANVPTWRTLVESTDPARQRLGFAVLLQLAADPPAPRGGAGGGRGGGGGGRGRGGISQEVVDRARAEARAIIDGSWTGPAAASLVWAVGRTGAVRYSDRVDAAMTSADAATREAAAYARARLAAVTPPPAAVPAGGVPTVGSIPYENLLDRLSGVAGDVALGRKLFVQQSCSVCHTTTASEPEKGPFLGGIYTRYSKAEVLESIIRPAAKVAQGFATHVFTMADKRQLSGFVVREGPDDVVIRDLTGAETTLRKAAIASRSVSEGSVMLRGLVDSLTLQDLASLLAFLESTSGK